LYNWRKLIDKLFTYMVIAVSIVAISPVIHLIITVLLNGTMVIVKTGINFFISLPPTPFSKDFGGIAPAIVGSLLMTFISLPITIVLGLFAAILTTEFPKNTISIVIDTIAKSLASIPTIAVSMIVYTIIVVPMRSFSALAGSIALTIVSLPYAYTYFSTTLRSVPFIYREAAFSIAMSRWSTVLKILIPVVRRGIVTAILMTLVRILGETAALLFTAGRFRNGVTISPLAPADAIPLLIFDFVLSPYEIWRQVAWGASALLLLSYMVIFFTVKFLVKEVKL